MSSAVEWDWGTPDVWAARVHHNGGSINRTEEYMSELQSHCGLVSRIPLEKKKFHRSRPTLDSFNTLFRKSPPFLKIVEKPGGFFPNLPKNPPKKKLGGYNVVFLGKVR